MRRRDPRPAPTGCRAATTPPKPISLTRFLIQEQQAGHINADLRLLIEVVARACKSIATAVG